MNAPEQSPEDNSPQATQVAHPRHHIEIAKLLLPLAVLGVLIYLLRGVPDAVLRQEFEGLGAALCAGTYAVILFWRVSRIISPKIPPPDVPDPEEETLPDISELSQKSGAPNSTGPNASGVNPGS